ncbi:hypothetical protein LXL04_034531 [Taraxacum kok-saghyz]
MVSGIGMENWIGTVDDDTESIWPDRESKINTTDRECYPKCPMVFTFFFVTLFRSCLHCSATKRTTSSNREKESQASLPSAVDRGAILISDCASSALVRGIIKQYGFNQHLTQSECLTQTRFLPYSSSPAHRPPLAERFLLRGCALIADCLPTTTTLFQTIGGTVPASLVTYASIQALKPDPVINAGTAGAFKVKGACIFDMYLVSDLAFHDRWIYAILTHISNKDFNESFCNV